MKKWACFLLCGVLCVLSGCRRAQEVEQVYVDEGPEVLAEGEIRDVAVLFTSQLAQGDIWDYAALAGLATDVGADFAWDYMALVDCGGAVAPEEGDSAYDRIELMNSIGYHSAAVDAAALSGGVQNFMNYANAGQFDWLSANLVDENNGFQPLSAWTVMYYGQTSVAFVGVSVPGELPQETGEDGQSRAYSLRPEDWYLAFQSSVDAARAAEVDYVIGLGCLGAGLTEELIGNTEGLDAYLDGSGELSIEEHFTDFEGRDVFVSGIAGGTAQAGKLVLAVDGSIRAELLEDFDHEDAMTLELIGAMGYSR